MKSKIENTWIKSKTEKIHPRRQRTTRTKDPRTQIPARTHQKRRTQWTQIPASQNTSSVADPKPLIQGRTKMNQSKKKSHNKDGTKSAEKQIHTTISESTEVEKRIHAQSPNIGHKLRTNTKPNRQISNPDPNYSDPAIHYQPKRYSLTHLGKRKTQPKGQPGIAIIRWRESFQVKSRLVFAGKTPNRNQVN